MARKKILFCGHRCFAAQGLQASLEEYGHEVLTFSRGPLVREGNQTTGPVRELAENSYLDEPFDTVINYIQLRRMPVEDNEEYIRGLLRFCESRKVKHLIHISSCSAYKNNAKFVDENAPVETDPSKKGVYAAVKAAQENVIKYQQPAGLKVSLVRPGLILANGMGGFMGGIGVRLPWNSVLGLGHAKSQIPLVTREAVNASVLELINNPPEGNIESLLLADTQSPTRRQYVENCCEILGGGTKIHFFPVPLWLAAAFCAEILTKLIGKGHFGIYGKVSSVCRFQRFNASRSEKRLGIGFSADWKKELHRVFDNQEPNFVLPSNPKPLATTLAKRVNYIGFGRIVKQRHLPALKKLGFHGEVKAYDLVPWADPMGIEVQSIQDAKLTSADLTVVCTPGPVHIEAIDKLKDVEGPVLVEKPLCYNNEELEKWLTFAREREDLVMVCHNTRYKSNVLRMLAHLAKYNPGKLHHVSVIFQSGPVNKDSAAWLRDERGSRTLLLDYGLHRIDLACMFAKGSPRLEHCRHELNQQGETILIEGVASFENYTMSFLFRQGLNQRKDRFVFVFQNYLVSLGFYPDTFVPHMVDDNFGLSWLETWSALRGTVVKTADKLFNKNSEHSHAHVIQAAISKEPENPLMVEKLVPVYDLLFQISRSVYGE